MHRPQWPSALPKRNNGALWLAALAGGVVGAFLSRNFFESEKKITELINLPFGVDDPQFSRTVSQLLGPPLIGGNKVDILENGDQIFPAMLEAIASARRTITFENFVLSKGHVASAICGAFTAAARRGVKVHFLQDSAGCNCVHGSDLSAMEEAGVQVEIFRYFHLRFNERTHRKLLVIDGEVGFIGGAGISDQWMGKGNLPDIWRDTHYRVQGPAVAHLQQAFLDNWMQTRGCVLVGDDYFPELHPHGPQICQAFQSSSAEGADSARLLFLLSIAAARKTLRIANAYFIPDDLTVATLVAAARRGVTVEVIVPGKFTDQHLVRYVGKSRWQPMLEAGIRFFQFQPARYHCKYMIVDSQWACVGSCNLDNRSLRLNEEANLNILGEEFAARHVEVFERDKAQCREISMEDWKARPLKQKVEGYVGRLIRSQI